MNSQLLNLFLLPIFPYKSIINKKNNKLSMIANNLANIR